MARPSATTAALLLLLVSLTAVAHCRPVEPQQPATDADSSAAAVAAGNDDENGPPKPLLPADAADQVVLPAEEGFLRLPSHRLRHHRRPCRHGPFHRHLWWARHHGVFGDDAPRRFPFPHHPDADEVPSHLPVFHDVIEAGEPRHVAEPDPDRLIPDEVEVAGRELSFGDADGGAHEEAVRAWKKEMMRRWFHFHHGMRHHRLHRDEEEGHENEEEAVEGSLRRFHHRRHHEEDEEKGAMRKRFRGAEHDEHSDDEDDEVEEIVRRFRKGIMRGRSGHGRRFHHRHHHGHRHGEEADAREEGGVVSWIKGLMNRF